MGTSSRTFKETFGPTIRRNEQEVDRVHLEKWTVKFTGEIIHTCGGFWTFVAVVDCDACTGCNEIVPADIQAMGSLFKRKNKNDRLR